MTTKVKPTVGDFIQTVSDGMIERLGLEPDGHRTWATTTDEIVKELSEELSEQLPHSVQEAKAERDGEWVKALKTTAYTTPTDNSTSGFIERVVKAIDLDLLASLKQEEEV